MSAGVVGAVGAGSYIFLLRAPRAEYGFEPDENCDPIGGTELIGGGTETG